jgi:hypothetical protein
LLLLLGKGRVSSQERSEFWYSKFQMGCGRTEARSEETKRFIRDVNVLPVASSLPRRGIASRWKVSGMIPRSETSVAGKAFGPAPTMLASKNFTEAGKERLRSDTVEHSAQSDVDET